MMLCALALRDTLAGAHLAAALDAVLSRPERAEAAADSARAIRDMAFAAMRRLGTLRFLGRRLSSRAPAPLLAALQMTALAELLDGRRPVPVVIDQAVAAARALPEGLGNRFSAGFLNATLRRFAREREGLLAEAAGDIEARHEQPAWWIEAVRAAWPQSWQSILATSLQQAPLTLRVNRRRVPAPDGVDQVAAASLRLAEAGLPNRRVGAEALVLDRAVAVERIPGFADGDFTVQDAGAQLAAPLLLASSPEEAATGLGQPVLAPRAGERILDACAAPGGKTTHLLQLADCRVLAIDQDAGRLARVRANLAREGLPLHEAWPPPSWGAVVRVADATEPAQWWDGEPFDRILLDAPCSASGIVRRHPDVPWHRRRRDLATLASRQRRLLAALWPTLRPGGTLLYVTCSIFPEEGEEVIAAFCSHQADCTREPVTAPWLDARPGMAQLLPTSTDVREHDGYFYARLKKRT